MRNDTQWTCPRKRGHGTHSYAPGAAGISSTYYYIICDVSDQKNLTYYYIICDVSDQKNLLFFSILRDSQACVGKALDRGDAFRDPDVRVYRWGQ